MSRCGRCSLEFTSGERQYGLGGTKRDQWAVVPWSPKALLGPYHRTCAAREAKRRNEAVQHRWDEPE